MRILIIFWVILGLRESSVMRPKFSVKQDNQLRNKAKYTKYSAQESGVNRTYKTQSSPEFAYASHFFNDFFFHIPLPQGVNARRHFRGFAKI